MEREENCREMAAIMRQISPEGQRYLVELARAAQKVERCLGVGAELGTNFTEKESMT